MQGPKRRAKERRTTLRQEITELKCGPGSDTDRTQTLVALNSADARTPTAEQAQIVHRLVKRVNYDGVQGKLSIVLRQDDTETPTELSA